MPIISTIGEVLKSPPALNRPSAWKKSVFSAHVQYIAKALLKGCVFEEVGSMVFIPTGRVDTETTLICLALVWKCMCKCTIARSKIAHRLGADRLLEDRHIEMEQINSNRCISFKEGCFGCTATLFKSTEFNGHLLISRLQPARMKRHKSPAKESLFILC